MIDTACLEAWCFYAMQDSDDDVLSESKREMAADIMAVLAELKAAREVVAAAREGMKFAFDSSAPRFDFFMGHALDKYDAATQPNSEPS